MLEQNRKIKDFDGLIDKLKPYLRRYLEERDVEINDKGWFRCINPSHEDKNPSCGFVKDSNEEIFYCFSCGCRGRITDAAFLLEDKPLHGKPFLQDNVLYLADKYGIDYDSVEITPEELHIRRVYDAYTIAAEIISEYQPIDYVTKRKWPITLCRELQIGSVKSYNAFVKKMENSGYDAKFIQDIDLNKNIFNEGMLIFTVKDERGRVVGFSGRNMNFIKGKSFKFINTSAKCPIYKKSKILYGLSNARRNTPPLYILEGYPDYVSTYKFNLLNSCAIGGTALTREHIDVLKDSGIDDCILALDGDDAGQNKIQTLLDNLFSGEETFKIRIVQLPSTPGECDPDEFIEKNGIEAFKELPILTPFQWRLNRFSYDDSPNDICDKMIPFVINDPNEVHRETMARQLADRTEVRLKTILKQIDKLVNADDARKDGLVQSRLKRAMADLQYGSTDDPIYVLQTAADDIRQIHSSTNSDVHSKGELISYMDEVKDMFLTRKPGLQGWKTGFDMFDTSISGIPKEDAMITFAGDANVGKTGLMFQLALNIAKLNDNVTVLFMSIDDSRQQALARMVALESGLRINQVAHPVQNIKTEEDQKKLDAGWAKMRKLASDNRFSLKDNTHGNTLDFAEAWIRWAKEEYPGREICFFLDNFHKLGDEVSKDERIRFKHASARIHAMKNKLHFTAICTMEIRKLMGGGKNKRPMLQDISESKQMEYDNNLIGMVYNDLHARRQEASIVWMEDSNGVPITKPVFEIDIQKNKISEYKGVLYYKFAPEYSKFYESTKEEIQGWQADYNKALQYVRDTHYPSSGQNPFKSSAVIDTWD